MKTETAAIIEPPFTRNEYNVIVNATGAVGVCWEQLQFPANYRESKFAGRTLYAVSLHDAGETVHFLDGEVTRISRKQFHEILDLEANAKRKTLG